jgi:hypothetical protein
MPDALTQREELDHEAMWSYLRRLRERVYGVLESETIIDDCLDVVIELMGADRGLILLTFPDGGTQIVNARSARKTLSIEEQEEISRTIVREAIEARRCVTWLPLESAAGSASMAALGIVAALAAPLHGTKAGGPSISGVLYVDVRDRRKFVGARHIEFFMSAALLLGATFEQSSRVEIARQHLREAESHCLDSHRVPSLGELLAAPG